MKNVIRPLAIASAVFFAVVPFAQQARSELLHQNAAQERFAKQSQLRLLARKTISPKRTEADSAIAFLRAAGPEGMIALNSALHSKLQPTAANLEDRKAEEWNRIVHAYEKVGAQHDNWASHLYWFTDLEKAKAQSQKEHKSILSLRLLGNLEDELTCANSRFFRTALYPNSEISATLRSHFILHWQSVRAVPKVTIDFGNGRKIQTTVTGNSIHYVLDSQGRVLDALPGLNGPKAFLAWLGQMELVYQTAATHEGAARDEYLGTWHKKQLLQITKRWQSELDAFRVLTPKIILGSVESSVGSIGSASRNGNKLSNLPPTARMAASNPVSKVTYEKPLLSRITLAVPRDRNALKATTDDAAWEKIAARHADDGVLDDSSLQVLRSKVPPGKAKLVAANFEKSIAQDTVRNEYLRHTLLHQWLGENPDIELNSLNRRVYDEMFLTPDSDPWLGLLPTEAYSAIVNNGVTTQ